jgi:hypothetical protein
MSFVLLSSDGAGFLARVGERVRLIAWLPASTFRVLPWEAPGPAEITSVLSPGLANVRLTLPWEEVPSAWTTMDPAPPTALPSSGEDPFVVRAEGTLKTERVPLTIPMGKQTLHVAAVWREPKSEPAPTPAPSPISPDPTPGSATPPSPRPSLHATPEPLPPPKPPRTNVLSWALGLGAVFAAVTFVRSPFRRAR